jgi:hypothetical protein
MSTATDTTSPPTKRTRFSEKEPSSRSYHVTQPPKLLAESFIKASIASLPHPIIATDVEKLGKEHILLLSKKLHLEKANQRLLNDNDVIPQSARSKFELSCSDRVKELPEYKELQDQTTIIVSEMQTQLKQQIIAASKLEIMSITNDIQRHLAKSIRFITNAFLIINNDTSNVDAKVYMLAQKYLDNLSTHTPMTLDKFVTIYKSVHTIETFPPHNAISTTATTTIIATATPNRQSTPTVSPFFCAAGSTRPTRTIHTATSQDTNDNDDEIMVTQDLIDIKTVIENVFVSSWTQFVKQQTQNEITIQLKKLSSTYFTTRSTTESVTVVDAEPAADKKELKALIRLQTIAENKNLSKQLETLKKEFDKLKSNSKNSTTRGQGGASNNKNKSPPSMSKGHKKKTQTKPSPSKRNNDKKKKEKVGDNNKGNVPAKKKSKTKNGNSKSKKIGSSSNNKTNQQKGKSSKK